MTDPAKPREQQAYLVGGWGDGEGAILLSCLFAFCLIFIAVLLGFLTPELSFLTTVLHHYNGHAYSQQILLSISRRQETLVLSQLSLLEVKWL